MRRIRQVFYFKESKKSFVGQEGCSPLRDGRKQCILFSSSVSYALMASCLAFFTFPYQLCILFPLSSSLCGPSISHRRKSRDAHAKSDMRIGILMYMLLPLLFCLSVCLFFSLSLSRHFLPVVPLIYSSLNLLLPSL